MINILIVDEYQVIRDAIKRIISDEEDMRIVAEAATTQEAFDLLTVTEIHLIILDINLSKMKGFYALKRIKKMYINIPVLIISNLLQEIYAAKSLKMGALGYVSKDNIVDELVSAIRIIHSGNIYSSLSNFCK